MNYTNCHKAISRFVALLLICTLLFTFAGCFSKADLVGEYIGTAGSYLKLNKDGTCIYAEDDSTGTGTGKWYVEDGIIYVATDNIGHQVSGDVSDFDGGILLDSDWSSWNAEYFIKQD